MVGCKKNGKEDVFVEVMSIVNDNAIGTFLTEKWENEEILGNQR